MNEIQVNKIYKYFKGKLIRVVCIGLDLETKKRNGSNWRIRGITGIPKGTNMV